MDTIFARIRDRARQIASRFPSPDFYKDCAWANRISVHFFETDPVISRLREFVIKQLKNNYGHGPEHAVKVAVDAGTLIIVEGKLVGYSDVFVNSRLLLVQCAGLLHDIKRGYDQHAAKGSVFTREFLKSYDTVITSGEAKDISQAIQNHEAFQQGISIGDPESVLISDSLYDSDKFRWGPDNFKYTVWDMLAYTQTPLSQFMASYPKAMSGIAKIKETFRTKTGKKYGPQFIDTGIAIGEELYKVITTEFTQYL